MVEGSYKEIVVPAGSEGLYQTFLELLMDIRDLLAKEHEESLLERVEEARKGEENRRKEEISARMKLD